MSRWIDEPGVGWNGSGVEDRVGIGVLGKNQQKSWYQEADKSRWGRTR